MKLESYANNAELLLSNCQLHRHDSNFTIQKSSRAWSAVVAYISFVRRPATLRTRYANRLNPENNRNVPLPSNTRLSMYPIKPRTPPPTDCRRCGYSRCFDLEKSSPLFTSPGKHISSVQRTSNDPMYARSTPAVEAFSNF